MKSLILILLSAGLLHSAPAKFNWKEIKIGKVAYVSLNQAKTFYTFDQLKIDGKSISLETQNVKLELTEGSQEMRMNGVKIFLSESVRKQADTHYLSKLDLVTLIDPLMRPNVMKGISDVKVIVLDAGHGGKDKGAGGLESKITLSLAKQTKKLLENKGYKVILTRNDDINVPLEKRVAIANAEKNAVVISLHFNSGDKNARGFETHIVSARKPNKWGKLGLALGVAIHSRSMLYLNNKHGDDFQLKDRGVRHSKYRLLVDCEHPTVLIEGGFLSNAKEAEKINSEAYQKTLALAIVRGVDVFRLSLKK